MQDKRRSELSGRVALLLVLAVLLPSVPVQSQPADTWSAEQRAALGAALTGAMEAFAQREDVPSVAVGVFTRDGLIWSGAHGFSDEARTQRADERTLYHAGSISKLFTDIVAMQLVDEGKLDLDRPVRDYLPGFAPRNPFGTAVTLRLLMTHRSGLVREPPVGSYYDIGDQELADVVASLNQTSLVAAPGTLTKYSNAAIAVVGRIIEVVEGKPYAQVMRARLLDPLGMSRSAFATDTRPREPLAHAVVATYDTERVPAPRVGRIGLDSAGGLVTSVADLALFGRAVLNRGQGPNGRMLAPATFDEMVRPQAAHAPDGSAFGIGFHVHRTNGAVAIGHNGAIYGYVAQLTVLPEQGLGVVAFATRDLAVAPFALADFALRTTIALRDGSAPPTVPAADVALGEAERLTLQGHYLDGGESVYVRNYNGDAWLEAPAFNGRLRRRDAVIALDSGLVGPRQFEIDPQGRWVRIEGREFRRGDVPKPPPPPESFADLIGEYGPDHNIFRVFERDGRPYLLAESVISPMTIVGRDRWEFGERDVFYQEEHIVFERDASGRATAISLNGIRFERRTVSAQWQVVDAARRRELSRLLRAAKRADPPANQPVSETDLVSVQALEPGIRVDLRYATPNNFAGIAVYGPRARARAQRPAAEALARAHRALAQFGYGIVVHDAYRPWYVTKLFWDMTSPDKREFVANPAQGSRHNRGAALDVSLYELQTGEIVTMPGGYDEASHRSYPNYTGGTSQQRWLRELLRLAMEREGFDVYPVEWWHYDLRGWERFPIGNQEP